MEENEPLGGGTELITAEDERNLAADRSLTDCGFSFANGGRLGAFDGAQVAKMAECTRSTISPLLVGTRRVPDDDDTDDDDRGKGRKRRRTLRFDSSGSSDSGVAALSSTDTSSQSSGTSDITEPCSPPSPETPRSCTPLPASINNFNASRNCLKNCNQPFTANSLTCAPCDCEPSLTFEQVKKGGCDSRDTCLTSSKVVDDASIDAKDSSTTVGSENIVDFKIQESQSLAPVNDNATCLSYDSAKLCKQNDNSVQSLLAEMVVKERPAYVLNEDSNESSKKPQGIVTKLPTSTKNEHVVCQWDKCIMTIKSGFEVVEHLQNVHVAVQKNSKTFACLWSGCKVYNRTSCSLSWLERHVVSHAGSKPFHCIVDGCGQRFTSQGGLERHVNSHFNQPCSSSNVAVNGSNSSNPAVRRKDDTPTKVLKKKRLRYRRRGWAVKMEDFFDSGTMECVQHHLVTLNNQTKIDLNGTCRTVTFHSNVMARRIEGSGKVRVLVHWIPENIFPDQWILESQVEAQSKCTIPLTHIPRESFGLIDPSVSSKCHRKNRRK